MITFHYNSFFNPLNIDNSNRCMDDYSIKQGFLGQKMIVVPNDLKKLFSANPVTRLFSITDIGYYPKAANHRRTRVKGSNEYIFIYCVDGMGFYKQGEYSQTLRANNFLLIPKNEGHSYWADSTTPWSIYWMHFEGTLAAHLFKRYLENPNRKTAVPYGNEAIHAFNQIFEIYESDYAVSGMEYANILGLHFLSSFIYDKVKTDYSVDAPGNLVNEIITYLMQNLDKTFKAEEISTKFKFSYSYIFNIFKKRTGYSLFHFFNLKKIQKSCEYLNYSDLSIKEIAFLLGFHDPLYFSRLFKKHIGVSPKNYRKKGGR